MWSPPWFSGSAWKIDYAYKISENSKTQLKRQKLPKTLLNKMDLLWCIWNSIYKLHYFLKFVFRYRKYISWIFHVFWFIISASKIQLIFSEIQVEMMLCTFILLTIFLDLRSYLFFVLGYISKKQKRFFLQTSLWYFKNEKNRLNSEFWQEIKIKSIKFFLKNAKLATPFCIA